MGRLERSNRPEDRTTRASESKARSSSDEAILRERERSIACASTAGFHQGSSR
jgi:hypothetical protein